MAEKLVIELDLEKGDVTGATKSLAKAGEKSGRKAAKEFASKFNRGVGNSVTNLAKSAAKATAIVGALGSALATVFGVKAIRLAQQQEDAVNSLNSALTITKNAGLEASQGIQDYASELQQVTRFGDEVILQNAALIQSLGDLTEEGLKGATTAAADMAAALRIDLASAATLVGKAAAGEIGSLSRYGVIVKSGANNAETFANTLEAINTKFGGAAARDVLTYSGSVDQLGNAFGDVFEEIGFIITRNPKFIKAIKATTDLMVEAGASVANFAENFDAFEAITSSITSIGDTIINNVIAPLELLTNVFTVVQNSLNSFVAEGIAGFAELGGGVASLFEKFGIDNPLTKGLKDFAETSREVANENMSELQSSIAGVFDFPISDKLAKKNEELRTFFTEQNLIIGENSQIARDAASLTIEKTKQDIFGIKDVFSTVFAGIPETVDVATNALKDANKKIEDFSKSAAKSMQQGLAGGAANAFAAFGSALASGKDAMGAFTQALIKSIGEQAVALGTKFILEGTAYLFSANPKLQAQAPGLIKSGAALAAFGGAVGAAGGGGGESGSSEGGAGVVSSPEIEQRENLADPELTEDRSPQTNVQLTVQGSLVQQEELGQFITETLNESFQKQGVTLTDARLA